MRIAVSSKGKFSPVQILDRADCEMPIFSAKTACERPFSLRYDVSFSMPPKMTDRHMTVKHEYVCQPVDRQTASRHNMSMNKVKTLRIARGLTQAELAKMTGIDQGFISKIERDEANPTLQNIKAIAKALGAEPPELFDLPEFQRRVLETIGSITDPDEQAAAMVVLQAMARRKK